MGLATNISRVGQFARQGDEFLGSMGLKKTLVGQMASKALKTTAKVAPKLSFLVSKKEDILKEGKQLVKAVKEKDLGKGFSAVEGLARLGKEAVGTKEYKKEKGKMKPLPESAGTAEMASGDTFYGFG
jgi:hypothetical protein